MTNKRKTHVKKGDRVKFKFGARTVRGIVREDRGPIGIGGRRLYLIEFKADPLSPNRIELPVDEFQTVRSAASAK